VSDEASRSTRATRGRAFGALLAWIVTLGLCVLALEGLLRLCGMRPVVTINEPDHELGWVKRRNESTRKKTSEYDVTFAINSVGLRGDPAMTHTKPPGRKRVLFVGDSFVLGYTVEPHDHFVDLVGAALHADGRDVEALNGGTEGYSTDQEVLWLQKEGLSFEPDAVVACFFQNDVFWNGQSSYAGTPKPRFSDDGKLEAVDAPPPPPRGWLVTHSALGALLDPLMSGPKSGPSLGWVSGSIVIPHEDVVVLASPPAEVADCWARTKACFKKLKETCDGAKVPLLFVAIPSKEEIDQGAAANYAAAHGLKVEQLDPVSPAQKALAAAKEVGLTTLDPRAELQAAAKDGTQLYYTQDWHVNPFGSRVLGRAIYRELAKTDWLGSSAAPTAAGLAVFDATPPHAWPRWPFVIAAVWIALSLLYAFSYRDERPATAFLQVGAMIGAVVLIVWGFGKLVALLGPQTGRWVGLGVVGAVVVYLLWKMAPKLAIIREVYGSFLRRGLWYMIPLLVAMLSIGGLLVVASSSPFLAPFIYTLF
jgi:hypothetical protein